MARACYSGVSLGSSDDVKAAFEGWISSQWAVLGGEPAADQGKQRAAWVSCFTR